MNKEGQVWPDIMDGFKLVLFNYFFHAHLDPGRNTNYKSNIPVGRFFHNGVDLSVPVAGLCNLSSGLIKRREPEWYFFGSNPTEITGIIAWSFLKICTSA